MKLKNILAVVIAIIFIFVVALIMAQKPKIILFYSNTCVHCQNVKDFIVANNVEDKVKFKELEVSNNSNNSNLLIAKAKSCKLDTSGGIGVPFLFDGQNCLSGDIDIINFFQEKIK